MQYKMIVSDYDNTICKQKKSVTQRTRDAIAAYTGKGGRFVICTTRPYSVIKNRAAELCLQDEIITNQGAYVRNLSDGSIVSENILPAEQAREILDYVYCKTGHIFIASDFEMLSKSNNYFTQTARKSVNFPLRKTQSTLFDEIGTMDVAQIIIGYYSPLLVLAAEKLAKRRFGDQYAINACDKYLLNFTKKDVSKGRAIETIANIHGIQKHEIAAFGDSVSDYSMFEYSGMGVAMGNAAPALKKLATAVCGDVEADGLAVFIEQNCLD